MVCQGSPSHLNSTQTKDWTSSVWCDLSYHWSGYKRGLCVSPVQPHSPTHNGFWAYQFAMAPLCRLAPPASQFHWRPAQERYKAIDRNRRLAALNSFSSARLFSLLPFLTCFASEDVCVIIVIHLLSRAVTCALRCLHCQNKDERHGCMLEDKWQKDYFKMRNWWRLHQSIHPSILKDIEQVKVSIQ